jgi:probable O-glycosylation ligase (exosortase A-associated)
MRGLEAHGGPSLPMPALAGGAAAIGAGPAGPMPAPAGQDWWRPRRTRPAAAAAAAAEAPANAVAFRALVAFTAILLLSPQAWFPVLAPLRIAFLAAGVAIAGHLLDRMTRRGSAPPFNAEVALALALVAWAVITLPVSYWAGGSVDILTDQYLKAVAFFWLVGTLATTGRRLRILAWTLVLCAIPLAATGISNYLSGEVLSTGVPGLRRIYGYMGGSGLAANPNDLALVLNLIVPIAAALMLESRRPAVKAMAAASALVSIACIVVTFSRAGFLTLATTAAMLFVVLLRRRSAGAATLLLLVTLAAPVLMPDGYMDRLSTITNIEADRTGSAQGRWEDFLLAGEVIARNPVVGVGLGADMIALNEVRGEDTWRSVHNAYLQYGVDLGIPGLVLFAALHILCFRAARRVELRASRDPALAHLGYLAAGIQVSLAAFFVAAMFHPIAYQFYFFTIAGLAVALKNSCRTAPVRVAPSPTLS